MIKKLMILMLAITTVSSWGYASYTLFAPKEQPAVNVAAVSDFIATSQISVQASSKTQEGSEVVCYIDDDTDSDYVTNQILNKVYQDAGLSSVYELPVKFVVVSDLEYTSASKRKSEYGFSSYPALVTYETNEEGTSYAVSSLEYNVDAPFTVKDVETYLSENTSIQFEQ